MYWLEDAGFVRLKARLEEKGAAMHEAKKGACEPLSKRIETGFVPQDAWETYPMCKRQLSWYKTSHHFGLTLVVNSHWMKIVLALKL